MKKKLLSLLLAATMVLSLAACGGSSSGSGDESKAPEANSGSDSDELTVWTWDPNFNIKAMEKAGEMTGIKVNVVETSSDDCEAKLTTAATSGQWDALPDIILMQDNSFQKFLDAYPDAFTDVSDCGIDWSQFSELKQAYSMKDGKHYGVPFDNGAVIACWRTDILEQAGYTVADLTDISWQRLIEIGEDVYSKTGKYMLSGQANSPDTIMMMLQSCGAALFDDDGNAYIDGNPALDKIVDIYVEMVQKNVYLEVNSWDDYIGTLTKSTVAGTINGNWITASIMSTEDQKGLWEITNMPSVDGVEGATHYSNNGGSSWYITKNCKNVELAEKLLTESFGSSTEFYDAILPETGAISTYAPAADTDAYKEPQAFWNDQPIFATIVEYSLQTPDNFKSPYHYEGRAAIATAVQAIIGGADKASSLQSAQQELEFNMQ